MDFTQNLPDTREVPTVKKGALVPPARSSALFSFGRNISDEIPTVKRGALVPPARSPALSGAVPFEEDIVASKGDTPIFSTFFPSSENIVAVISLSLTLLHFFPSRNHIQQCEPYYIVSIHSLSKGVSNPSLFLFRPELRFLNHH